MAINGALGGLVAITAGSKTMDPAFAIITGLMGGFFVVVGYRFMERARIDDVVGAIPVHGFAGVWGTIATGLFFRDSLFNMDLVLTQVIGVISAFVWAFCISWVLFKVLDWIVGIRASTLHEQRGLDFTEHHEIGYSDFMAVRTFGELGSGKERDEATRNKTGTRAA